MSVFKLYQFLYRYFTVDDKEIEMSNKKNKNPWNVGPKYKLYWIKSKIK